MAIALASKQFGAGPPLIVLHGLFGSGKNWTRMAHKWAPDWSVHTPDLRNHGASDWDDDVRYEALADDIVKYLDSIDAARAVIVGHSMGGKVAMTVSLRYPQRVHALLVVDIAPVGYAPSLRSFTQAMKSVDLGTVSGRSDVDQRLQADIPDTTIRAFLVQNIVFHDGVHSWRFNLDALDAGMDTISGFPHLTSFAPYDGPTLFLAGARSDYVTPAHHQRIHELFPGAGIETVAAAGHWIHAEAPDAFLAQANRFLATV